jgi:hypothetical protein
MTADLNEKLAQSLREGQNWEKEATNIPCASLLKFVVLNKKLLQTSIDDYRKNAVSLILAPYLINIKKLSYGDAFNITNSWLSKCGELRQLDYNVKYVAKYALKFRKSWQHPLRFHTLKLKNKMLYDLLSS